MLRGGIYGSRGKGVEATQAGRQDHAREARLAGVRLPALPRVVPEQPQAVDDGHEVDVDDARPRLDRLAAVLARVRQVVEELLLLDAGVGREQVDVAARPGVRLLEHGRLGLPARHVALDEQGAVVAQSLLDLVAGLGVDVGEDDPVAALDESRRPGEADSAGSTRHHGHWCSFWHFVPVEGSIVCRYGSVQRVRGR